MDFSSHVDKFDTEEKRQQAKRTADRIRAQVGRTGLSSLDFGCGPGLLGMELLDVSASMVFLDSSQGMIDRVEEKIAGIPQARALCCDIQADPSCLDGCRFDLIFSSLALHHLDDVPAVLKLFFDFLNPQGQLFVVEMDKDDGGFHGGHHDFKGSHGFDREELRALLEGIGFADVEAEPFGTVVKGWKGKSLEVPQFLVRAQKR